MHLADAYFMNKDGGIEKGYQNPIPDLNKSQISSFIGVHHESE